MPNELNEIIANQVAWAERHGIPLDRSNRCPSAANNLFMPLNPSSVDEFGDGCRLLGRHERNSHALRC